jgi:hypothetical protein
VADDRFDATITVAIRRGQTGEPTKTFRFAYFPQGQAGRRIAESNRVDLTPLRGLVAQKSGYEATLRTNTPVDLGGFTAIITQSNTAFTDPSEDTALLTFTVRVLTVADPRVFEWLGNPVREGAEFTVQARVPIP